MENVLKDLGKRLREYAHFKRLGTNQLGRMIGSSGALVSNILNGKNFGMNKFLAIGKACPDLNLYWLLTGQGKMLLDGKVEKTEVDGFEEKRSREKLLEDKFLKDKLQLRIGSLESAVAYQEMTIEAYKDAWAAAKTSNRDLKEMLDCHVKTIDRLTTEQKNH